MPPLETLLVLSTSSLLGLAIVAGLMAWGWRGWLELQHHRFDHAAPKSPDLPATAARIDLADLKERIRKLEAIAAGVEL